MAHASSEDFCVALHPRGSDAVGVRDCVGDCADGVRDCVAPTSDCADGVRDCVAPTKSLRRRRSSSWGQVCADEALQISSVQPGSCGWRKEDPALVRNPRQPVALVQKANGRKLLALREKDDMVFVWAAHKHSTARSLV